MPKNSEKVRLIALIFASILAWTSFLSVVFFSNPKSAGVFGAVVLVAGFIIGLACFTIFLWQMIILRKK